MTTATGAVRLRRRYFVCRACGLGAHPGDEWLGLHGSLSRQALRLATLAAASWSFDRASALLREFCGLSLSDDTIRSHSLETAGQARDWQRQTPVLRQDFQHAAGAVEFSTDGTSVNTLQGWREMRLAVFAKRVAGNPATPAEWDSRTLPTPSCRVRRRFPCPARLASQGLARQERLEPKPCLASRRNQTGCQILRFRRIGAAAGSESARDDNR